MPAFERIGQERPTPNPHVALVYEPKRARLLVAVDDARHDATEVWEHLPEGGWTRIVAGAVPRPSEEIRIAGPPVAWVEPDGEVVIARIAPDGLRTFRAHSPTEVTFLPFSFGDSVNWVPEAHAAWIAKVNAPVVLICSDNEAQAYLIRDGAIVAVGDAPYVHAFAPVHDAGMAVGYDIHGTLWAFDGSDFFEVEEDPKLHGLAWYAPLDTIVSLRPAGDHKMVLASWQEEGFVDIEPEIAATTYRSGGRLAITDDLRIVYYGGQDFEKGLALTSSALVSAPGGRVLERDDASGPRLGRYTTAITTRSRLVLADHSSLTLWTPDSTTGWKQIGKVEGPDVGDDRNVNFAGNDDTVFVLDGKGALLGARDGEPFRVIAKPDGGPGPRYSGRVALAWDSPSSRLVVFGDTDCNATWIADDAAFLEIRPKNPPPHGVGSMVSTNDGAYLLVQGEIHRFSDRRWTCVAPAVPGNRLFWDPKRDRLMTAGWDKAAKKEALWVIAADGVPRVAAHFPPGKRSERAFVGVDPAFDRLLLLDETDRFALPLATIEVDSHGMPKDEKPMSARRLASPPPGWTRPALHVTAGEKIEPPQLETRGELRAILPAHPDVLPLPPGYIAIAISETRWWEKSDKSERPWELGGGGTYGRLVREGEIDAKRTALVRDGEDGARALIFEPYVELDRAHAEEVDTLPGPSYRWSWLSKLGGYPHFVQDDPTKNWQGPPLRFVGQIGGAVLGVGDAGYLFIWIEASGDSPAVYVVSQSH